jgi:hypothetical protein
LAIVSVYEARGGTGASVRGLGPRRRSGWDEAGEMRRCLGEGLRPWRCGCGRKPGWAHRRWPVHATLPAGKGASEHQDRRACKGYYRSSTATPAGSTWVLRRALSEVNQPGGTTLTNNHWHLRRHQLRVHRTPFQRLLFEYILETKLRPGIL